MSIGISVKKIVLVCFSLYWNRQASNHIGSMESISWTRRRKDTPKISLVASVSDKLPNVPFSFPSFQFSSWSWICLVTHWIFYTVLPAWQHVSCWIASECSSSDHWTLLKMHEAPYQADFRSFHLTISNLHDKLILNNINIYLPHGNIFKNKLFSLNRMPFFKFEQVIGRKLLLEGWGAIF